VAGVAEPTLTLVSWISRAPRTEVPLGLVEVRSIATGELVALQLIDLQQPKHNR
jgi:hypothetical protein